jgi:hypothetical protein
VVPTSCCTSIECNRFIHAASHAGASAASVDAINERSHFNIVGDIECDEFVTSKHDTRTRYHTSRHYGATLQIPLSQAQNEDAQSAPAVDDKII